ncbi:YchJ family protein [Thalassotalea maritima]|uniref:YchJ family protein n=1 Tax=Thalassotalea maritima TaxID=3242416 RepID=UPI003528E047
MTNNLCPCGSNRPFSECCSPIIDGLLKPNHSEALMRSRYTAYVLGNAQYVADTYASSKQADNSVDDISDWMKQTKWLKLEVIATEEDNHATQQYVEFKAYYLHQSELCVMHEKSRFVIESEHWRYIDGDIIEHNVIKKIGRNEDCPCLSGKKLKRCCGK